MASPCFDNFLRSLSRAGLTGLLNLLTELKIRLEIDKAKSITKGLRLSAVLTTLTNLGTSFVNEKIQQLRGATKTFGLNNFQGCPTVDSMIQLFSNEFSKDAGKSFSNDFSKKKTELVKSGQDGETTTIESRISFIDQLIVDIQTRLNELGTE